MGILDRIGEVGVNIGGKVIGDKFKKNKEAPAQPEVIRDANGKASLPMGTEILMRRSAVDLDDKNANFSLQGELSRDELKEFKSTFGVTPTTEKVGGITYTKYSVPRATMDGFSNNPTIPYEMGALPASDKFLSPKASTFFEGATFETTDRGLLIARSAKYDATSPKDRALGFLKEGRNPTQGSETDAIARELGLDDTNARVVPVEGGKQYEMRMLADQYRNYNNSRSIPDPIAKPGSELTLNGQPYTPMDVVATEVGRRS